VISAEDASRTPRFPAAVRVVAEKLGAERFASCVVLSTFMPPNVQTVLRPSPSMSKYLPTIGVEANSPRASGARMSPCRSSAGERTGNAALEEVVMASSILTATIWASRRTAPGDL
jgi:hypothetical protein